MENFEVYTFIACSIVGVVVFFNTRIHYFLGKNLWKPYRYIGTLYAVFLTFLFFYFSNELYVYFGALNV